jgi:hydroxyquinol 1,2-dioxygenase
MTEYSERELTDAVVARMGQTPDPRLREVMTALVRHLHAFVREVEPTESEWFEAIKFLTATGQKCDDKRQEFILLSDTLGVSMLVDQINHRKPSGATPSTVLGPFYVENAPEMVMGADIATDDKGSKALISGRITDPVGRPIAGAMIDVWQANTEGFYDVQFPDLGMKMRARLRTGNDGHYSFRTAVPVPYPVPTDGPVGAMLKATGRHAMRPGHTHFIISAPGYETLTTHLFAEGDKYLDSDAVFAVKNTLITRFVRRDSAEEAAKLGVAVPFYVASYDFSLEPAGAARAAAE